MALKANSCDENIVSAGIQTKEYFFFKIRQTTYKARMIDIVFLESNKRKLTMHLVNGNKVEFYGKLKEVYQEQLHDYGFFHIHASYVVNFEHIASLKFKEVKLAGGMSLPISQQRRKEVRKAYLALYRDS